MINTTPDPDRPKMRGRVAQCEWHTAQPQNSISLDQEHENSDFLAKSLDNTILHGERAA